MSRTIQQGRIKVWFVPTLTAPANPSLAEITTGTNLTPFLRDAGDSLLPMSGNLADASTADSRLNKTAPGTYGGDTGSMTLARDDEPADDDAWTALPRGAEGFLVVAWLGGSGTDFAIAATDEVTVAEIGVITRRQGYRPGNDIATFLSEYSIAEMYEDVTVAV